MQDLQKVLDEVEHCSMTTDFWTSRACEGFVTVTCHIIDKEWNYLSYVLNTYQVTILSHTAEKKASELKAVTNRWNITEKVIRIVMDNASNMTVAVRLTPWKNLHVPCFAYTLNLIIQKANRSDTVLVELRRRYRDIVTFF